MKTKLKIIGRAGSALAFLFCLLGGLWILKVCWAERGHGTDNALYIGIGFYFVGKAFFVGPMLWLVSEQVCGEGESIKNSK